MKEGDLIKYRLRANSKWEDGRICKINYDYKKYPIGVETFEEVTKINPKWETENTFITEEGWNFVGWFHVRNLRSSELTPKVS